MYPSWGSYGGGYQPPPHHFGMRPHLRGTPPTGGMFGGYVAPQSAVPVSNFSSLREQHLQQMQQLQQLHQKQLQSVLHNNGAYGSSIASGPGTWQGGSTGYSLAGPSATSSGYQDQQLLRSPSLSLQQDPQPSIPEPPQSVQQSSSQNNRQETSGKSNIGNSAPSEKDVKPDFSTMTLQEQQQYWYKQHLQNLQKLKNDKSKHQNAESQQPSNSELSAAPPPPVEPPKNIPPPPPPKEQPPPPPPPDDSKSIITPPGDPAEAARLQQLQAAAAQWQQAQQQRAGFQYQALMQQHAQLQQILQQYQQFIQQPAHLQTMPLDLQLRHYEMQEQQFAPVYQEWDRQFKLWQEQFQVYPHKDQLQDYESQWKQWQEQMKSTSVHLQERVATLRAMQQQYGTGPFGGMMGMPQYGQYRPTVPEMQTPSPHSVTSTAPPSSKGDTIPPGQVSKSPLATAPLVTGQQTTHGLSVGQHLSAPLPTEPHPPASLVTGQLGLPPSVPAPPSAPPSSPPAPPDTCIPTGSAAQGPRLPGPLSRFEGPRDTRFEGPRGNNMSKLEQQQRFSAPPQFAPHHRLDPLKGTQSACFEGPGRFEPLLRPSPPVHFERPLGPSQLQAHEPPPPSSDTKPQKVSKTDSSEGCQTTVQPPEKPKSIVEDSKDTGNLGSQELMSDDILDSSDGFFVQSDPIPQTTVKSDPQKKLDQANDDSTKKEKQVKDIAKPSEFAAAPIASKLVPVNSNNYSLDKVGEPLQNSVSTAPSQKLKPLGPSLFKPDISKPPPGFPQVDSEMLPSLRGRGRGRGMLASLARGRGRGWGRGQPMGPPHGLSCGANQRGEAMDSVHHSCRVDEEMPKWQEMEGSTDGRIHLTEEEMWGCEEDEHYQEGYYKEHGRRGPPLCRESLDGPSRGRHWEEPEPNYCEQGDPYWTERRPSLRHRPPFLPQDYRRPPPPHGFVHHGPRRLPPPHKVMERDPRGPPLHRDVMEREPMGPPHHHHEQDPRGPFLQHDVMERDLRRPPPPPQRDMMDREHRGPPQYHHDAAERDLGWLRPPPKREPRWPPHSYESLERDQRWPPPGHEPSEKPLPPHHEAAHGDRLYDQGYRDDFGPEAEDYRLQQEYQPQEYESGESHYAPRSEWDTKQREREFQTPYPCRTTPEHILKDQWAEDRERLHSNEGDGGHRGDMKVRDYSVQLSYPGPSYPTPPPLTTTKWEQPLQDMSYSPESEERQPQFEAHPEPHVELMPHPAVPGPSNELSDSSLEKTSLGAGKAILALSQRQHEIILKAAQELKMIRELQETKNAMGEFPKPEISEPQREIPEGLIGLEIPPEVRTALQATNLLPDSRTVPAGPAQTWDTGTPAPALEPGYLPSQTTPPALPKPPVVSRTVDYGHSHDAASTVERISYGERIVLRPDPISSERTYEKEHLGPREPYDREPYLEWRTDPYLDRREYGRDRDRDLYREKPTIDYERERYERERYSRDDRLPTGPPPPPARLPVFREREPRDSRESRSSRDREDIYGRPLYDRPLYDRLPDRPFEHGPPGYSTDRRSYPEERLPVPPSSLPPPVPSRLEKKPKSKNVDDILKPPGRESRPERIVIIMRGLPGSGKTHVAKLIRDKEVEFGGAPPRVLGLDDYFMTEIEKTEKDPDTGKRVKRKVLEYEYEPEMEETYRNSMLKTFRKTLDDGFFPFIIIDTINDKVKYFDQFWSAAKTKGFEVYLAEITADNQMCAKRNVHGRKIKDIMKMASNWEPSPRHMVRLDIRSLLQDAAIEEVEMEDFNPSEEEQKEKPTGGTTEEEEGDLGYIPKSKWEMDTSEAKLDKLDGLVSGGKRKRDNSSLSGMEDFLQLPDDYATRLSEPGKKRVRWADLEEKKDADRKRAIGFVVGQTDWEKITDESGQLAQRALNRTKYF